MQYPGQVNKIAAGSAVIMMNFEPKWGVVYIKWVWFKCVPKINFMKLVTAPVIVAA